MTTQISTQSAATAMTRLTNLIDRTDRSTASAFLAGSTRPLILCDCSVSMSCVDVGFDDSRHTRLEAELQYLLDAVGSNEVHLVAFGCSPQLATLPLPADLGSTNLAAAVRFAHSLRPSQLIIISDGQPNSKDEAIDAIRELFPTTRVDCIYIGPESDSLAQQFLASLAQHGGEAHTKGAQQLIGDGSLGKKIAGLLNS
jgi:hypothetical protein